MVWSVNKYSPVPPHLSQILSSMFEYIYIEKWRRKGKGTSWPVGDLTSDLGKHWANHWADRYLSRCWGRKWSTSRSNKCSILCIRSSILLRRASTVWLGASSSGGWGASCWGAAGGGSFAGSCPIACVAWSAVSAIMAGCWVVVLMVAFFLLKTRSWRGVTGPAGAMEKTSPTLQSNPISSNVRRSKGVVLGVGERSVYAGCNNLRFTAMAVIKGPKISGLLYWMMLDSWVATQYPRCIFLCVCMHQRIYNSVLVRMLEASFLPENV